MPFLRRHPDAASWQYRRPAGVVFSFQVSAPHRRNRLWFVADSELGAAERRRHDLEGEARGTEGETRQQRLRADARAGGTAGGDNDQLADSAITRRGAQPQRAAGEDRRAAEELGRLRDASVGLADAEGRGLREFGDASLARRGGHPDGSEPVDSRGVALGDAYQSRPQGRNGNRDGADERAVGPAGVARVAQGDAERRRCESRSITGAGAQASFAAGTDSPWSDLEWLQCTDGKARPTQSGLFPLAHGLPARVGRLRGYGNAIVPQVAQAFIEAVMECMP